MRYLDLFAGTHVSLFSGIGGIDLAAEWAGFETILQVENDSFCQKVLRKHWPNVKRIERIEDVTEESVDKPVTLISGGPPCQPSSTAGKRRGREDDRWLWPEFARVVECFLPSWVLAENPLGILSLEGSMAIEEWFACLETKNYTFFPPLVYPIAAFGADHRRYRVFFVAHLDGVISKRKQVSIFRGGISAKSARDSQITTNLKSGRLKELSIPEGSWAEGQRTSDTDRICEAHADANGKRSSTQRASGNAAKVTRIKSCAQWDTRSRLLRMVHGIRGRMDGRRIKALGNSCSPQQAYPILKAIADIEIEGEPSAENA